MEINYLDAFDPENNKVEEAPPAEVEEQGEPLESQEQPVESAPEDNEVHSVKKKVHERIAQLQREKYQAFAELEHLRQQNHQLQQSAQASLSTATNQYNETLVQRMARLKDEKIKAREENDIEAEANADIALSLLAAEFNRSHSFSQAQPQIQPRQQVPYQQQMPNYAPVVESWASQNTWFDPASRDYDPELSAHINGFSTAFNENLYRNGRADAIFSPEYLHIVSEEAERVRNSRRGQNGELNMQQARGGVSRVSSGYNRNGQQRANEDLNTDQRDLARRLGVDEKVLKKFIKEDARDQARLGRR